MNDYNQQEETKKNQQEKQLDKTSLVLTNPIRLIQLASEQILPTLEQLQGKILELQSENTMLRLEKESDTLSKKIDYLQVELIKKTEEITKVQVEKKFVEKSLAKTEEQLNLANIAKAQLEKTNKDLHLQSENKGKDIENLKKENLELLTDKKTKAKDIEKYVENEKGFINQIKELKDSRFALFVKMIEQFKMVVENVKSSLDGNWGKYLGSIKFVVPKEESGLEEVIDGLITPERSTLCRLISIRWWALQPRMRKEMRGRFDVDLMVCLTELLIESVKQFGYDIVVPSGELYTSIDSTGYNSYGGDFSVVTDLFSEEVARFDKKTFSEVAILSYSRSDRSVVGELAFSKKQ